MTTDLSKCAKLESWTESILSQSTSEYFHVCSTSKHPSISGSFRLLETYPSTNHICYPITHSSRVFRPITTPLCRDADQLTANTLFPQKSVTKDGGGDGPPKEDKYRWPSLAGGELLPGSVFLVYCLILARPCQS